MSTKTAGTAGASTVHPFELHIDDEQLMDLRNRLQRTRFPESISAEHISSASWALGTDVAWLRDLTRYWLDEFDWRAQEARLNLIPQYQCTVAGSRVHFLHVPGRPGPARRPHPLLLSHGWPGSIVEFLAIIPRLTDPAAFGADPDDAFTVVAPSLPGYTLSAGPDQPRLGVVGIAEVFAELMTDVLGYERFGVQGGDWGAWISARMALDRPEQISGLHLNFLPLRQSTPRTTISDPAEKLFNDERAAWIADEGGYQAIQSTRPQTLAIGLHDSPAGLAAWIGEKFHSWSDHDGDVHSTVDRDALLTDVCLYWFTGAIGSSFWPYYARAHEPWPLPPDATVDVPTGYCEFPAEIFRPPRVVAERTFSDIRRWTHAERGGHFAALEQPDLLAADIRAFFRPLRQEA